MTNEFGIIYDLRKDLLLNEDVKDAHLCEFDQPLKIKSLLKAVQKFFTPELIMKYSLPIYPDVTGSNSNNIKIAKYRWEKIEIIVREEVKKFTKVPLPKEIEQVTHFVGNQIFLFLSKNQYPIFVLKTIIENLVFTWQGTINLHETYLRVLETRDLSDEVKFQIACKNFISEEVIFNYLLRLPEDVIIEYLHEKVIEENIPVYFWICRYTGIVKKIEDTPFQTDPGEYTTVYFAKDYTGSPIDYLFLWAMFTFNDMALHYIWENFTSHAADRHETLILMLSLVIGDFRMANIVIYLLSKISDNEINIFFEARSSIIFEYLIVELRWKSSFFKVLNVLHEGFQDGTHVTIFKFIISVICKHRNGRLSRRVLEEFLMKMPIAAKCKILDDNEDLYYNLLQTLYNRQDLESCSLLLEIGGPLTVENLYSTNLGKILFEMHISNLKFTVIDDILKYSWTTSRSIHALKTKFFQERAFQVCHKFISIQGLESLNLFVNWCLSFVSLKDIMLLKSEVLLIQNGEPLKKLIFQDPETDVAFEYVDKILEWCFGSEDLITYLKSCIIMVSEVENRNISGSKNYNIYSEIRKCASEFQFQFLRHLFEWKPCSFEEVKEIKTNLMNDKELFKLIFHRKSVLKFFSISVLKILI
ncbi:UNVERIFIED_CONTAM: hypothetical protein RMT77_018344 [Armadillidium vulgare]